jgi:hypothetical protein
MFQRVLLPIDGSAFSEAAIPYPWGGKPHAAHRYS